MGRRGRWWFSVAWIYEQMSEAGSGRGRRRLGEGSTLDERVLYASGTSQVSSRQRQTLKQVRYDRYRRGVQTRLRVSQRNE